MKTLPTWLALLALSTPATARAAAPIAPTRLPAHYVDGVGPLQPLLLNESGDVVFEAMRLLTGEGTFLSSGTRWTECCTPADVTPRGTVVGACGDGTAYWVPGAAIQRVLPDVVDTNGPRAVNARGEVVGYFYAYEGLGHYGAYYWSKEAGFVDTGLEGLEDINDRGLAVGRRLVSGALVPVTWSRDAGVRELTLPEGHRGAEAQRVNNRGQVLGAAYVNSPERVPVFWDMDGSAWVLTVPEAGEVRASDLNERGQVLLRARFGPDWRTSRCLLWSRAEGLRDLGTLSEDSTGCWAADANNYGEVVGWSGGPWGSRAFFWDGQGMVELAPSTVGSPSASAAKINDSGLIIGSSVELQGGEDFEWQPVRWQIPGHPQGPAPGSEVPFAPEFEPLGTQRGQEQEELTFVVRASDPNDDAVTLRASGLPEGATFDPATGAFAWTPGEGQAGSYRVAFAAADDGEPPLTAEHEVTLLIAPLEDGDSGGTGCFVVSAGGPPIGLLLAVAALAAALRRPDGARSPGAVLSHDPVGSPPHCQAGRQPLSPR